jgi:lipopolysaccharide transport system permease protein
MMTTVSESITETDHCATDMGAANKAATDAGVGTATPDNLPVTVFQRRSGWRWVDLGELWRFRELLFFLTWRDIKVRYKQTVLGAAWAVLQPFATMVVFSLFLRKAAGMDDAVQHYYPLYVFAGLLPWIFFANAITQASQSVVGNEKLVTKIYFPRLIIPMAAVGAGLLDLLIACCMLLVMVLYYAVFGSFVADPGWNAVLLPLTIVGLMISSLGIGTLLAALTVAYRDFRYVVPFAVQLWMFATANIYLSPTQLKELGPAAQYLMPLNPAYGLIANFRVAVLGGGPLDVYSLVVSVIVSILLLLAGCLYFRRVERSFADII